MFNPTKNLSIHQLFEVQALKTPDAVAVTFDGQQLTYRELNEKANQLAHYLKELGVKPEVLVGVCVERSLEMVIGLLGILKAGGAYVPLDLNYPKERLGFIIEDAQLSVLLSQQNLLNFLPDHQAQIVDLDSNWQTITQQPTDNPLSGVESNNLAYIIYTSGSTGRPKGVAIEHRNTVAFIEWAKDFFTPEQLKGVLASTSICFDLSIFELFVTLSCGGKVILAKDALELPNLPEAKEVTLINTVPSAIASLLRNQKIPSSVHTINLAGEPLQNALVQKLYQLNHVQQIFNLYGPTEDTTYSTVALMEKNSNEIPPIGRPISNTQIYLLTWPARRQNDEIKPVPDGVPGEIYIGGAGLARGYFNRPDLTAQKFIRNPFSDKPEERLYKTGDLAIYLPDGNLKFLGRTDDQVKIRGFRVELGEVEAVLNQYPGIRESVILAKEDKSGDKRLVAYIVPTTDSENELDGVYDKQLQQWKNLWDAVYAGSSGDQDQDPTFNTISWNDSFTGLPIPANEMHEWVDLTVERILSLRPQRVLEIGCGVGLLLFRIAPHCTSYFGMDISAQAIHYIRQQIQQSDGDWSHVNLAQGAAHELNELDGETFDTVVINSVIQYFPSLDYLVQILEKIIKLVKPGGQIFIGDVRSLPLLETFHTAVQLSQASDSLASDQLQQQIQQRVAQEKELVIHPDFFTSLKDHIPQLSHVQILLKRGYAQNEVLKFRSDVILHLEKKIETIADSLCWDWQRQDLSVSLISQFLQENQPEFLKIINIPNARVFLEVKAVKLLASLETPKTVGELREELNQDFEQIALNPEIFWDLGQDLSYGVDITWSESGLVDRYDVFFKQKATGTERAEIVALPAISSELKPWSAYANNPLQSNETNKLVPQLQTFLRQKLAEHMIPSMFVVMENFPLTPNGKIDKRSLPEPKKERPDLTRPYAEPCTSLEKQLSQMWSQILDIDGIGISDNFFELGGHSILVAQLIAEIEEKFQINLPIFYFFKEPTIIGLIKAIDIIRGLQAPDLIGEGIEIDLKDDTFLDPTIYPEMPFVNPVSEPEHVFLTGSTGFLGAFLLHELLSQTQANIYCLIRASNLEEGDQKIQKNLKRYQLWDEKLSARIIPILGDLSQPLLGLTEESFRNLANKLDLIYHCGALVNLIYPYDALRAANVLGTQEVLRLAAQGKLTPVNFVSTTDVLKPLLFQNKIFYEDDSVNCEQDFTKGYIQTKWVAEKLVLAAQSRGIPTRIYRPGMISGNSQTGVVQTNDVMCRLIKGMIQLGVAPDLDLWVNLIPVDYVSKTIVYLSRQPESVGKTFHLINPKALHWSNLVNFIRGLGYPLRTLSHEEWQTKLLNLNSFQENALYPILSVLTKGPKKQITYLEAFLLIIQLSDCQNTLTGLKESSLSCPPVDEQLLNLYFSYFTQSGFLKPPVQEENTEIYKFPDNSKDGQIIKQKEREKHNYVLTSKTIN